MTSHTAPVVPAPEQASPPSVRAAIASRVNVHARSYSGCRAEITQTPIALLDHGATPVVCQRGSVGAIGDLAPIGRCGRRP